MIFLLEYDLYLKVLTPFLLSTLDNSDWSVLPFRFEILRGLIENVDSWAWHLDTELFWFNLSLNGSSVSLFYTQSYNHAVKCFALILLLHDSEEHLGGRLKIRWGQKPSPGLLNSDSVLLTKLLFQPVMKPHLLPPYQWWGNGVGQIISLHKIFFLIVEKLLQTEFYKEENKHNLPFHCLETCFDTSKDVVA